MATEQFQLPFNEQIEFLKQKVNLPTATYKDIDSRQHDKAFVVAGAMKGDLLTDLHNAVNQAVVDGQSFKSFQDNFDDILAKHGWLNDEDQDYKAWRAKVIYQTNMRTSHAAGRYKQMTDPEVLKRRPYWRYRHNTVENPRIQHERWNNLVLPADSQWWRINFPPNGYGCKCTVEAINERQLRAMGKTKPDDEPSYDDNRKDFLTAPGASWTPDLNKYPESIATSVVDENIDDGVQERWLARIAQKANTLISSSVYKQADLSRQSRMLKQLNEDEQLPVAVIPQQFQNILNVSTQVLLFKEMDVIEQAVSKRNNTYADIQHMFGSATQAIYQNGTEFIVLLQHDKQRYLSTLQKSGAELRLKSYGLAPTAKGLLLQAIGNAELIYQK